MSNIKGGGRAILNDETQAILVDLLMDLQEQPASTKTRKHEREAQRRRFVRKLVKRHERQRHEEKYNGKVARGEQLASSAETASKSTAVTALKSNAGGGAKVRIELVEAIYSKQATKKAKAWKPGSVRKTMVLPRLTLVTGKDFLKQAKNKLRTKAVPCRCFCVEDKGVEVALNGDLAGVEDGVTIYVTSTASSAREEEKQVEANPEQDLPDEDPLDAVKQAYKAIQENKRRDPLDYSSINITTNSLPILPPERAALPAADFRERFLETIANNRVVIVSGSTGCGKSTQIPQFLREGGCPQILVTQPRRVAAVSLARRVADECQCPEPGASGSLVGYQVRLDRAISHTAQIVYCTVGIVLRMLLMGDTLEHISVLVVDEVHERDVNTDFLLTLLRAPLQRNLNLRVVLMSATAATDLFVTYFSAYKPAVLSIPGRTFPVHVRWLRDCERAANSQLYSTDKLTASDSVEAENGGPVLSPRATGKIDNVFIVKLVESIVQEQQSSGEINTNHERRSSGAILIFLPGKAEIEALMKALQESPLLENRDLCKILKLHSTVPKFEQRKVFVCAEAGTVKIVLSTNVAETSITIPGKFTHDVFIYELCIRLEYLTETRFFFSDVSHVIDTGRVKESRFNASSRIKELVPVWTSQASAKQRMGRAGRTTAGVCWRLYSEEFSNTLPSQTSPEIIRTPLDELVLQICLLYEQRRESTKSLGVSPIKFLRNTPEPPPVDSIENACQHLLEVGALETVSDPGDATLFRLTPLGYHLSCLPMDAKVGKVLIVGCILECVDSSLTIAAALSSTKSCFLPSRGGKEREIAVDSRRRLVESGFGGANWKGGTVKGDLIAVVAIHRAWLSKKSKKERLLFCRDNALDYGALDELHSLRTQFRNCLVDAGFLGAKVDSFDDHKDDALLASCCLVAGLYPNIATLVRPRKGGFRDGRLLTRDGDVCRPNSSSFQSARVRQASEKGKDVYAVFHSKHRSVTTDDKRAPQVYLAEVNFVSRYALLLFGGKLKVEKNAIIVDDWLKFKVGEKGVEGAVLILELRKQLDVVMLRHMRAKDGSDAEDGSQELITLVRKLLAEEFG